MGRFTRPNRRDRGPLRRSRWLVGCLGALLAFGLAWGDSAIAESRGSVAWAPEGAGYSFGLMPFSALPDVGEWSLGLAKDLGREAEPGQWSYFGAGVSLARPAGGEPSPEAGGRLGEVELGAWVGGCVRCNLGGGATLDLEMRLAPQSLSLGGDPFAAEQRSGLMLRIPW